MARVTRGFKARRRRNRVLKEASGYYGTRSRLFRTAKGAVERSLAYAFRDRKVKKRTFRSLWITRINAAVRDVGLSYSSFIAKLKESGLVLDRKVLAGISMTDPQGFSAIVKTVMERTNTK